MHGISAGDKETGCVSFLYQPINEVFTIFLAHGDRLVAASCSIREGLLIGLRFSSVAGEHPGTQLQQLHKKFRRISVHDHLSFYARPHGRATVSLSQAQVIAAVEVLSRAL